MNEFRFINYDNEGIPTRVATDNGYCRTARDFNIDDDGWMLDQLNPHDFDAVRTGNQMEELIFEVNELRRENFKLQKIVNKVNKNIKIF